MTCSDPALFTKDPDADLDYKVNWATWMAADDTVADSSWSITLAPDDSLTLGTGDQADDHDATSATVWLLGGTVGKRYKVTNHIVTTQGREDDRTLTINVRDR